MTEPTNEHKIRELELRCLNAVGAGSIRGIREAFNELAALFPDAPATDEGLASTLANYIPHGQLLSEQQVVDIVDAMITYHIKPQLAAAVQAEVEWWLNYLDYDQCYDGNRATAFEARLAGKE